MSDALQQLIRQAEVQKLQMQMNVMLQKNLSLFKERMPQVYKMVADHKPDNLILRLDHNNKINLLIQEHKHFLYNDDPQAFSHKQVALFQKKSQVRRFRITKNKEYNDDHIHIPHLNGLIDEYEDNAREREHGTPNFIPSLIVSGVGLGHHLPELIKNFDIRNIMVYEKCVDSFYGSLQVLDWTKILDHFRQKGKSITLCIGSDPQAALAQIEAGINKVGLHSQIYTFVFRHTMRKAELDFIEFYQKELRTFIGGMGYYDDEQIGLAHGYHNVKSKSAVFVSHKTHSRKIRLLLIGNGPSLDEHKDYIEANKDNVIIMSCGTGLSSLLRMGIKPDFHVEMERCILVNDVIRHFSEADDRNDITLLCLHTVAPETMKAFPDCCYSIKANDAGGPLVYDYFLPQKTNELIFCNPTVTNCGLSFAVSMGFEDIHLIGVDLGAKDKEKHHSKHSFYVEMEAFAKKEKIDYTIYDEDRVQAVEGNFGGEVMAMPILNMARVSMERYLRILTPAFPNLRVSNTNDGAKIDGTVSVRLEDLDDCGVHNKQAEIKSIKKSHLHYYTNRKFEKSSNSTLLKKFYAAKDNIKLTEGLSNNAELYDELLRAYREISSTKDLITHHLLRGSVNTFFGSIAEHTFYCSNEDDFRENANIGVRHFNAFIDKVYEKMHADPFKLDETSSKYVKTIQERAKAAKENEESVTGQSQ